MIDDEFTERDMDDFKKKIDKIICGYTDHQKFLQWVSFIINNEEAMKKSLEWDEYQTRDFFASEGLEMLPGEVRYLMDAVEGIVTALNFFRFHRENRNDNNA